MFVKPTSSPTELREIATGLEISWVGKSNEDLANEINAVMQAKFDGQPIEAVPTENLDTKKEVETPATEEVNAEVTEEQEEETHATLVEESREEEQPQLQIIKKEEEATPVASTPQSATKTTTSSKWYEQPDAFPYEAGQKIQIMHMENRDHAFLDGRFAIINGPSTKKNAVKAQLINDKNGKLQKTNVTFNFSEFEVVAKEGQKVM